MKSRHLLALATGTCLGLAGLGQVAFADRGRHHDDHDRDRRSACVAQQDNDSENTIRDSENETGLLSLLNLNNVALQGNNISVLANALCAADVLNDVNVAVLGDVDDEDDDRDGRHGRDGRDGGTDCKAKQSNDSENKIGETENSSAIGLVNLGNVALQGNNVSALDNTACGADVANDVNVAVLGGVEDEDGDSRDGSTSCKAKQGNDSDNRIGDSENETGLLSLLNLNNVALQGNNISALSNLLCGADILNGLNVAVLGDIVSRS